MNAIVGACGEGKREDRGGEGSTPMNRVSSSMVTSCVFRQR